MDCFAIVLVEIAGTGQRVDHDSEGVKVTGFF